jgi:predicted nucleic acid-binding protein
MLIHVDTSVLVDAFTGTRRSLAPLESATIKGEVLTFCSIVLFEWLRGPRTEHEIETVNVFFETDRLATFGERDAKAAAALSRQVQRGRRRQADLAIAACAIADGAALWTLNAADFEDIPGLRLYQPPGKVAHPQRASSEYEQAP